MLLTISDYKDKYPKAADIEFFSMFRLAVSGIERPSIMDPFTKVKQRHRRVLENRKKRNEKIIRKSKMGVVHD